MSFIKNFLFPVKETDPTVDEDDGESVTKNDPLVERTFTPKQLFRFNGHDDPKIFISVKRTVFDVSAARQFYGPSGPYSSFAGHDASLGLALNTIDVSVIRQFDEPIHNLECLTEEDQESLDNWEEHFKKKYPVVGRLIDDPEYTIVE